MRQHNEHNRDAFSLSSTRPTRQPEDGEDSLSLTAMSSGISSSLAMLLEQRERLKAEIVRLLAPLKAGYPRVPNALRIDPKDVSLQLLQSDCLEFHRAEFHGDDCLWVTAPWWKKLGDKQREEIAWQYVREESSTLARDPGNAWQLAQDISFELGDLEYEIANIQITTLDELRALANVANEQFLSGRAIMGVIPYSFVANVLRVIGEANAAEKGSGQ